MKEQKLRYRCQFICSFIKILVCQIKGTNIIVKINQTTFNTNAQATFNANTPAESTLTVPSFWNKSARGSYSSLHTDFLELMPWVEGGQTDRHLQKPNFQKYGTKMG